MRYHKIKLPVMILLATLIVNSACKKIEKGFLSENIFYIENPMTVKQGITTVSMPLVSDGSTAPLQTKVVAIRNAVTMESADSLFLKNQVIRVFKDAVTYNDSTVEVLANKLKDSALAPFSIANIGGRLQFTSATTYIPQGTYAMDISVTNTSRSRVIKDAAIVIIEPTESFIQNFPPYNYLLDTTTQNRVYSTPDVSVIRDPSGPSVITFKWVDEDGKVFNPKGGEVVERPGLASFENWDPYYDKQLTDTSFTFQYPEHVPAFPVFSQALVGAGSQVDDWCYYRIPAKFVAEPKQESRTGFSFKFPNPVGSYHITIREVGVHKK